MKKHLLLSLTIIGLLLLGSVACIKKESINPQPSASQAQHRFSVQDTIRMVFYWGQSNCKGVIPFSRLHAPELLDTIPYALVYLRDSNTIKPFHYTYANGESGSTSYGAELRMMYELGQLDGKQRILFKWGAGGTNLAFKTGQDWNTASTGEYYAKMKLAVYKMKKQLTDAGHVVIFERMISYIGEADSQDSIYASNYESNLINFHSGFKAYFGASASSMGLTVIRVHNVSAHSNVVRTAQTNIGILSGNTWIDTDLWTPNVTHLTAPQYDSLGVILANSIVNP